MGDVDEEEIITGPAGRVHIGERFYKVRTALGGILEIDEYDGGTRRIKIKNYDTITLDEAKELANLRKMVCVSNKYFEEDAVAVHFEGRVVIKHTDAMEVYCGPTEISASVSKLKHLEKVHLVTTRVSGLPSEVGDLARLKHLWLHKNAKLTSLPSSICRLGSLVKIEIIDSPMLEALPFLGGMYSLRVLNVSSCGLAAIPESVSKLPRLHDLILPGNKIDALRALPPTLTTFNAEGNLLEEIEPSAFESSPDLRVLRLSRNKLKRIPPTVGELRQLRELYLDDNLLEQIPEQISALQHLAYLKLERNCIKRIPLEAFAELTMLERFDLAGNPLDDLVFAPFEDRSGCELLELNPEGMELVDMIEENICRGAGARKLAEEA